MMDLTQLATAVDGQAIVDGADHQAMQTLLTGVSIDSRTIEKGNLYVAIKGERFDGHDYIQQACDAGASAVLVQTMRTRKVPRVETGDTTLALGRLAAWWRQKLSMPVIGITGSNGKTTVKQMVAAILETSGRSGAVTRGNLNNHIGLPLSVLSLRNESQFGVFEMGMNHPGEIDYLTRIARPDVALINNAAAAHLEGLGDVQAVARAKGEIFGGLSPNGTAVINADDAYADYWRSLVPDRKVLSFGLKSDADVSATATTMATGSQISIRTPAGPVNVRLSVPGKHNVRNALAATAVALSVNISLDAIQRGLESFKSVSGRLAFSTTPKGACLINDSYNANPASVGAALDVLASQAGRTVFVMGDMAELGDKALEMHAQVLGYAHSLKINTVITLGPIFKKVMSVGALPTTYTSYEDFDDLIEACHLISTTGTSLLVKGSRSMEMERVVSALMQPSDATQGQITPPRDKHLDPGSVRNVAC